MIKYLKLFLLITAVVAGLGCVSPFYGTARIEKGWHMDVGLAATTYQGAIGFWYPYSAGGRIDFSLQYGFNKNFQLDGQAALGLGWDIEEKEAPHSFLLQPVVDGSIGFQAALPTKAVTPAVRIEAWANAVSLTPVFGFGREEWGTLGLRIFIPYIDHPLVFDGFIGVHPFKRWSAFGGMRVFGVAYAYDTPRVTLGIAYKIK